MGTGAERSNAPTVGELAILVDELTRRVEEREDSSEGMRVKVDAVDDALTKHEKICAARWGELTGGLRMLKWGLGLLLTLVSVVIGMLALHHH